MRFGLIGTGRRAEFFARIARQAPEHLSVSGVLSRNPKRAAQVAAQWQVAAADTVSQLLQDKPDFLIACVPWARMGPTALEVASTGTAVLTETPPAADLEGLRELWNGLPDRNLVQVAEQYLLMPQHAARMEAVRSGVIGDVTSVQVSSTHLYHAVSMMRGFLGAGRGPVRVTAHDFTAPLADPLTPDGWTGSADPEPRTTTLATLDFGDGRSALYDFTENQWWNPLRARRIVIRGTLGEIADDMVVRLVEPSTPVESRLIRRQAGIDLNLEGVDLQYVSLDGRVLFRNRFLGSRMSEDDLAVAELAWQMGAWTRGEAPAPYPLAEGAQDHQISLAIGESVRTGAEVVTSAEGWSQPG